MIDWGMVGTVVPNSADGADLASIVQVTMPLAGGSSAHRPWSTPWKIANPFVLHALTCSGLALAFNACPEP
jgi:hypothetical protein